MEPDAIAVVIGRVQAIQADVMALRQTIDGEALPVSDHQYVGRCLDLLELELRALREYLHGMTS